VLRWCGSARANNTVRSRLSQVNTFLRWCLRSGYLASAALPEALGSRDNPLRQVPRLYGNVQGKNPPRFLTREDADRLIAACQDGSEAGLRDEVVIRLGLAGLRAAEIIHLRWGNITGRTIQFIGKKRQARRVTAGPKLLDALNELRSRSAAATSRPVCNDDFVVPREVPGIHVNGRLSYGNPILRTCSVTRILSRRATLARLGHMSPHDLRRSAAAILHRARDEKGGHYFDLLDIQQVLGHKDPATTMRSYLEPLNTEVLDKAATFLD
jgi:integrase